MRKGTDKSVVMLLIMTLLMTVVWVGIGVYKAYTKVGTPTGLDKYLTPLSSTLKTQVLDIIGSRTP